MISFALVRKFLFAKKSLVLLPILLLVFSMPVTASPILITAYGDYNMGEFENIAVAKERAFVIALHSTALQAAVHATSYSRTKNLQLAEDEIALLSAITLEITDKHWDQRISNTGGIYIKATVFCRFDVEKLETVRKNLHDSGAVADYRNIQQEYFYLLSEMDKIKAELALAQNESDKSLLTQKATDNERAFSAIGWFNQGISLFNAGDWDGAIAALTQSLQLDGRNAKTYNNRSAAYQRKLLFDAALSDCNQAISLDSRYANAYVNRGNCYDKTGRSEAALADYGQAIAIDNRNAGAYNNRGLTLRDLGRFDEAIADFNQTINLDPRCTKAYNNRGIAYYLKKMTDQALADFNQAIALDPEDVDAYCNRGSAYQQKNLIDKATADYNKAIALKPYYAMTYYNRGNMRLQQGLLDLAVADYTQAVTCNPRYSEAYNNRGIAYKLKKQYDLAIADFGQVISLIPNSVQAFCNRGEIYAAKGLTDQAIDDFTQAAVLQPNNAKVLFYKAFEYDKVGRYLEAIEAYQAFLQYAPPQEVKALIEHAQQRLAALRKDHVKRTGLY